MEALETCALDADLLAAYAAERKPSQLAALVDRYRPLSHSLAARYRDRREPFEDLVQVADLGLVKAIQGFDPTRNTSFAAYAVPTILGELRRHFRDRVWNLRLPRALQEAVATVEESIHRLTETLGRPPTDSELAEETSLSIDEVHEALVAREARWTVSMDAHSAGENDNLSSVADLVGKPDPGFDRVEANLACSTAGLARHEHAAIRLRFGAGLTQSEVGSRMGVSQMQVSRVSRRGLNKLLGAVQGKDVSAAEA